MSAWTTLLLVGLLVMTLGGVAIAQVAWAFAILGSYLVFVWAAGAFCSPLC